MTLLCYIGEMYPIKNLRSTNNKKCIIEEICIMLFRSTQLITMQLNKFIMDFIRKEVKMKNLKESDI